MFKKMFMQIMLINLKKILPNQIFPVKGSSNFKSPAKQKGANVGGRKKKNCFEMRERFHLNNLRFKTLTK
mgnify:CR=1 FL=1